MTRLTEADCNFARAHITRFYDSDFYPRAFEFEALWAFWPRCLAFLTESDIERLPAASPRLFAAPKPGGDYRVVHQMDPISTIVYTALARHLAPFIEAARAPVADSVACAYRIELNDAQGRFFSDDTGYERFLSQCRTIAAEFSYVLVADIADFYNQVYLHRLQNALSLCHADAGPYSVAVEDYLIATNGGVSKGLPVGPAASIIFAEACLIDVDNMILDQGFAMTRYVDDIRVFGDSQAALDELLRTLTVYLYAHHRLSLAGAKTEIVESTAFVERYIDDARSLELQVAHKKLGAVNIEIAPTASIATPREPVREARPDPDVVAELMAQLCALPKLNLGLARHILRKSRRYRIRSIIPPLLERFSFFAPVVSDVVLFLERVSSGSFATRHVADFVRIYTAEPAMRSPFVRHWVDGYIARYKEYLDDRTLRGHIQTSPSFSAQAQCARTLNDVAWVRSQKQDISSRSLPDRRELYRTSTILAKEERNSWLGQMSRNEPGLLEQLVIEWIRST